MKNKGKKGGKLNVQFRGPYTKLIGLQDQSGAALKQSINCHRLYYGSNQMVGRSQISLQLANIFN